MINITFYNDGEIISKVSVEGHGGYGDPGEDIVCSAVSMLTITIINGIEEIIGLRDMEREVRAGYTSFTLPQAQSPTQAIQLQTLMDTFHLGVRATEEAYGEYVKVIEKSTGGENHDSNESSTLCP